MNAPSDLSRVRRYGLLLETIGLVPFAIFLVRFDQRLVHRDAVSVMKRSLAAIACLRLSHAHEVNLPGFGYKAACRPTPAPCETGLSHNFGLVAHGAHLLS